MAKTTKKGQAKFWWSIDDCVRLGLRGAPPPAEPCGTPFERGRRCAFTSTSVELALELEQRRIRRLTKPPRNLHAVVREAFMRGHAAGLQEIDERRRRKEINELSQEMAEDNGEYVVSRAGSKP